MGVGTQFGGACVRSTLGMIVAWPTRRHARANAVFSPPMRRRVEMTLAGTVEKAVGSLRNLSALLSFRTHDDRKALKLVRKRCPAT
jgi:hypothetical protein